MLADGGGLIEILGVTSGAPDGFYRISGDSPLHCYAYGGAVVIIAAPALTIVGLRLINTFAQSGAGSTIGINYNGIGGGATGTKYNAFLNGVINTNGSGVKLSPRLGAGVTSTGGQYS